MSATQFQLDPYQELFSGYIEELRVARTVAQQWWENIIGREMEALLVDRVDAERSVRARWPLGPVSFPRVIAVYRKYYLAVDSLNNARLREQGIERADPLDANAWTEDQEDEVLYQAPRAVLYERLDDVDDALARFLDAMVFIPIGADRDGRLV